MRSSCVMHIELQRAARHLLETRGNGMAVQRPERIQRLKDHQVECSLQNISPGCGFIRHANRMSLAPLERQMKSRARASHNHPLVMRSPAEKLSKSDGDAGVRDLRAAGWTAADVLARAKHSPRSRRIWHGRRKGERTHCLPTSLNRSSRRNLSPPRSPVDNGVGGGGGCSHGPATPAGR